MMMTRLDMMDAKLNAYSRTEVGSYSVVHTKLPISCDAGMKAQSKLKTKVTNFVNEPSPKLTSLNKVNMENDGVST